MKEVSFLIVLFSILNFVQAQSTITVDSSFGINGKVISDIGSYTDECFSATIQPDGQLIVAGSDGESSLLARINSIGALDSSFNHSGKIISTTAVEYRKVIFKESKIVVVGLVTSNTVGCARYNLDGRPDITFGDSGYVVKDIGQEIYPVSAALQNDSKILIFGTTSIRLNPDGTEDNSFGKNGKKVSDFNVWNGIVTENGEILLVGANGNVVLEKLKNDGSPDSTFNGTGKVVINPDGGGGAGYDVLVLPDRKILICGIAWGKIFVMRLNPEGRIDSTFGNNGIAKTIISNYSSGYAINIQPDGKILVVGYAGDGTSYGSVIVRYTSNGVLDATFNQSGYVLSYFGRDNCANEVVVLPNGKIIVAGTSDKNFVITKYNNNGTLDTSFGLGGYYSFSFRGWEEAYEVALDFKNRVIVLGPEITGSAVSRNNYDGKEDVTFDINGRLVTPDCNIENGAGALAIQNNDRIIVGGSDDSSYFNNTYRVFRLIRYLENGNIDVSFGNTGRVSTWFYYHDLINSIVLQPDGKIIAAGQTKIYNTNNYAFALARYNTDGSLDNSFDSDGKVITNIGGFNGANSVKIQQDGKIIAAGIADNSFAMVRYNVDGSPDLSFDSDGIVKTNFGNGYGTATGIALQADGKIVLAGRYLDQFAISRYNSNGSLDNSFGNLGKVISSIESNGGVQSLLLQKDGKIIIVGVGLASNGSSPDIISVRFNSNGSIDSTFGDFGILITDFGGNGDKVCAVIQNESKLVIAGTSYGYFALTRYYLFKNTDGITERTISIKVYPNPAKEYLTIEVQQPGTAEFIDLYGRIVRSEKLVAKRNTLCISDLIKGMYVLRIKTAEGIDSQKIIKL